MPKAGRPPMFAEMVIRESAVSRTVADISRATGVAPHTVRSILRRAADRGEIVVRRFVYGKCGRAIFICGGKNE